ncbi:MAG: class I SAM-dependent methyltransferase [Bacteroidota bacterium]
MAQVEEELWWYKSLHSLVQKAISKHFTEKTIKIVDAGCGTGGLMKFLQKKYHYNNLQGIDISPDAIEICRSAQLNVVLDDIKNISAHFQPASIDVIISNDTFYFLSEPERSSIIAEFYNLLQPKGLVIINLPALKAFRGIHDISVGINYRFSRKDIPRLVDISQFNILKATYWPFFLSPIIWFTRCFQRIKLKLNKNTKIISDINLPPTRINELLFKLIQAENALLNHKPFGSSLFLILQRFN